jgi:hypothetical protein
MEVYLGNIGIQNETYLGNINIPENNINLVPANPCPYTVGQLTQGGIVAFASPSGAFVMSLENAGTGSLGCREFVYPSGAIQPDIIGAGYQNTLNIATYCTSSTAAQLTLDYTGSGYTDWYLPNRGEWEQIFANRNILNANGANLASASYWMSLPVDGFFQSRRGIIINFANNQQSLQERGNVYNLRPIRYLCDLAPSP